jgi:Amt family ammonium transporter
MSKILKTGSYAIILAVILATFSIHAMARESGTEQVNSGDTAWVLVCASLVMLMTPAVGLFYGGMVRKKNVLAMIMQSFIILALISMLFGYSLAFGPDKWHGLIGGLEEHEVEGLDVSQHGEKAYL